MTDHTNLIAELRYVAQWAAHHLDKAKMVNDGAEALAALQDQLDIQAGSIEAVQAANQRLAAERDQLRAEVERLKKEYKEYKGAGQEAADWWLAVGAENAQLKERLTALDGQEAAYYIDESGICYTAERIAFLQLQTNKMLPLFLAAGAAPKEQT